MKKRWDSYEDKTVYVKFHMILALMFVLLGIFDELDDEMIRLYGSIRDSAKRYDL